MKSVKSISKAYNSAREIDIDDKSKLVFMSDCHRGDGNWNDNFSRNCNIYFSALSYYYQKGFTYLELGDGDELWENRRLDEIMNIHSNIYWLLSKFITEDKYYAIYGNHDKIKNNKKYIKKNIDRLVKETDKPFMNLFLDIDIYESLILKYRPTGDKILLIHGHQGDFLNDKICGVSRFMVRYFWKPLELYGVKDPTKVAKNYVKRQRTEKRIEKWIKDERCMVIAGHTHRPVFPKLGEIPYFNDGSCVHPRCITAIEIEQGFISLIKWEVKVRENGNLYIDKSIIAGPRKLKEYMWN